MILKKLEVLAAHPGGGFWRHQSTMPFDRGQSASPDEFYAVTAYLLDGNDPVADQDFVLSDKKFASIRLATEKNFTSDRRSDTATLAQGAPCMTDCGRGVELTRRARVPDVAPETETKE